MKFTAALIGAAYSQTEFNKLDAAGDDCLSYVNNESLCGMYDTETFLAAIECEACQGHSDFTNLGWGENKQSDQYYYLDDNFVIPDDAMVPIDGSGLEGVWTIHTSDRDIVSTWTFTQVAETAPLKHYKVRNQETYRDDKGFAVPIGFNRWVAYGLWGTPETNFRFDIITMVSDTMLFAQHWDENMPKMTVGRKN